MTSDPKTVSARLREHGETQAGAYARNFVLLPAADLIDAQDAELGRLKGFVAHQDEEIEALQIAHTAQHARATAAESSLARLQSVYEAAKYVVARWDTPLWKNVAPTAEFMNALRTALTAYEKGDAALNKRTKDGNEK